MTIVCHLRKMKVRYLCGITYMEMEWNVERKGIFIGHSISKVK